MTNFFCLFSVYASAAPGDTPEYTRCVNENLVSTARELGIDVAKKSTRSEMKKVGTAVAKKCQHLNRKSKTNPKCQKACRVCSASTAQLRKDFGTTEVPKRFLWAMTYVDAAGYRAYQSCVGEAVRKRTTAAALGCSQKALHACVAACSRKHR
jgi:hypothetical protein